MNQKRRRRARLALVGLPALAVACGIGQQAALVTVKAPPQPVIRQLVVRVSGSGRLDQITVPKPEGAPLTFPRTLSLVFPSDVDDTITVHIDGEDGAQRVASGEATRPVVHGGVTAVEVTLGPPVDGGIDGR